MRKSQVSHPWKHETIDLKTGLPTSDVIRKRAWYPFHDNSSAAQQKIARCLAGIGPLAWGVHRSGRLFRLTGAPAWAVCPCLAGQSDPAY